MTKKIHRTKKETRDKIKFYFDWWKKWLGLGYQRIVVKYVNKWDGTIIADAICDAKWQYLDHSITFCIGRMRTMNDNEIEITVIHELMHIFLNEMQTPELGDGHEDRVASSLTSAFMWVRDGVKEDVENTLKTNNIETGSKDKVL